MLKITPKSSRCGALGLFDGMLKWGVAAAPVEGAANRELVKAIAKEFNIPKSTVAIVSGESARRKRVFLCPDDVAQLERHLAELVVALGDAR